MTQLAEQINKYSNYVSFIKTEQFAVLEKLWHKTIGIFAGNRGGKTSTVAMTYFKRARGIHPIADKNRLARKIRCMSSTLPVNVEVDEGDNAQYIELKKIIPYEQIIKDVTVRTQNLVIKSPTHGKTIFEFRSSKQETQDLGKIDLSSVWHDEETPKDKRQECKMRLMGEGGDEIFTLTAINPLSYVYSDIWCNTSFIYRTKIVAEHFNLPRVEHHKRGDVACIQMATDDNPTLSLETIESIFESVDDPDDIAIRRYGAFGQSTGRVHKAYNPSVGYISFDKTFSNGIPHEWFFARGIDYHDSRIPWSVGWLAVSPQDEWFLWKEFHPAIDGPNSYNTYEIATGMARRSEDYEYQVNLIDPLANAKQPNTLFSITDDLNRYFEDLRTSEGLGKPAYWEGWDTKGGKGRDEIRTRFKNATRCGKPFNNFTNDLKTRNYHPTLWICDTCPKFHNSLMRWSYGEHISSATKAVNDKKTKPQQRFSHDNMVLEAWAKDARILNAPYYMKHRPSQVLRQHRSITGR